MGSAAGDTKLGTALKLVDVFSKVEKLIADVKNLAPEVHQALHATISDITTNIEDIVTEIEQIIGYNRKSSEFIDFNPFTTMLATLSLGKRPVKVPRLKSFMQFSPHSQEHMKGFRSKCTVLTVDLL